MISRRNWLVRCTIIAVLLYLFTHIASRNGASEFISELQQSGRSLAALDSQESNALVRENNINKVDIETKYQTQRETEAPGDVGHAALPIKKVIYVGNERVEIYDDKRKAGNKFNALQSVAQQLLQKNNVGQMTETSVDYNTGESNIMKIESRKSDDANNVDDDDDMPKPSEQTFSESRRFIPSVTSTETNPNVSEVTDTKSLKERLKEVLKCNDRPMTPRTQQRGDYWVLYNYIRAEERHECFDSVTYSTHADYTFLDNLAPLAERWKGPISIAMHAPGTDFTATLNTISYLRDCSSPLIKKLVTFHIFFSTKHVPKQVPRHDRVLLERYNCSLPAPFLNVNLSQMYKTQRKLLYPVNVGRNVARESAQTHFVLASDIELYPSPNLIPQFLKMIAENKGPLTRRNPRVFVLSIFEVAANFSVPNNKTVLKEMLQNGTAVPFHKKVCNFCHNVPKSKEWQSANETEGLHVFHIGKRMGSFVHWEPIYIGTHADPLYDERLSWEGKSDKMTQGYALCVLDYDFQILDNAFLCHKPGIKTYKKDTKRAILAGKTNQLIKKIIFPELKILYGIRKGCAV